MKLITAPIILALTLCSSLGAKTVYVSPKGTVSAAGDMQSAQEIMAALKPGDTCVFQNGVYRQSVNLAVSGTDKFDPRPQHGSFLVDAGTVVEGLTEDYAGTAPDPGAYEHRKPIWRPGPSWTSPEDLVLEIEAEVARSHALTHPATRRSIPFPERLRSSGLSDASLQQLQLLYDSCWTDEELKQRTTAVRSRESFPKTSSEYRARHSIVVELHRTATQRLIEKAPTVLSQPDLKLFYQVMPHNR